MRNVVKLLLLLLAVYLAIGLIVYLAQGWLLFPGAGQGDRGVPVMPRTELGILRRAGGEEFRVVTVRAEEVRGVLLLFGGNGEDLYVAAWQAEVLSRYGLMVVGVEYPGYGSSEGKPGLGSILECAESAAEFAALRAKTLRVPLMVAGSSLGSFPAVHVAARGGFERMLLRAPLTSLRERAQAQFWWLPVGLILRHPFDNMDKAAAVRCPVLIVHGDADIIVPPDHGERLAAALPQAEFVRVERHGHNDLDLSPLGPVGQRLAAFLVGR